MSAHIKRVLTAILAITMAVQASLASPAAVDKQDKTGPGPKAVKVWSGIQYGGCYTMNNQAGQTLGYGPSPWNILKVGSNMRPAKFKVCQSLGQCHSPNRYNQTLQNRDRFWLFDIDGNSFSPRGEFVAANSPPFYVDGPGRGRLYPGGTTFRYYVNFWGENDCTAPDSHPLGKCAVKLRVDNLRDDKGLVIQNDEFKVTASGGSFVVFNFYEASCPDN